MKSGIFGLQQRGKLTDSDPRLQIQRLDLKALISLKAIHLFIVRNWRKATKGSIRASRKCAQ